MKSFRLEAPKTSIKDVAVREVVVFVCMKQQIIRQQDL